MLVRTNKFDHTPEGPPSAGLTFCGEVNMNALGYFIQGIGEPKYFVQHPHHLRDKAHTSALLKAAELVEMSEGGLNVFHAGGVDIWPVYKHAECPPYVVVEDMLEGLGTFYTRWSPESPVPLEHDHLRRDRLAVVDFASTEEDAIRIVKQQKSKGA